MKVDSLSLILNKGFQFNKKFYFVSGNELSLIEKIKILIIENYKKNEQASLLNIDTADDYVENSGLFGDKKIVLIKNCKGVGVDVLDNFRKTNGIFLFIQENTPKIKRVKSLFIKEKDCYLIDCYELDKNSKIKILNEFIKRSNLSIEKDLYWFLIEKLDNRYAFLEDSLNKIFAIEQKEVTFSNVRKLLTINYTDKGSVFFHLLKNNSEIVNIYKEKIMSTSDANELYFYCKFYCQLIIESNNLSEYNKKIPVYLFKEKNYLVDIYKKYNFKKKKLLLELLSSTEKVLRKESDLSLVSGLRFILSIKKITVS
tara:strand:- start:2478 stop:3416 length:939 start_codon:yes stop_codon:yes gene_type:complete